MSGLAGLRPPVWAYIAAALVVVALVGWGAWSFDPFGRRKAAEQKATVAVQQTAVETAKTEAVERVVRSEVVIRQQAMEAVTHVQEAQGSDAPIDPAVAAAVRSGIDGLRKPPPASDVDGSADASRAVR